MQHAVQESTLQLRNIVKQLFEAAYSSDVNSFEHIATEFCYTSSTIKIGTTNESDSDDKNTGNGLVNVSTNGYERKIIRNKAIGAIRDGNGASLLHISSAGCNIDVIKWLIDKCPNLTTLLDKQGQSPIFYAIKNQTPRQLEVINLLLPYSDINKCDADGNSLLHNAIKYNNVSTIKFLISKGCNLNSVSNTFGAPINMAVTTENMEIIKLLVESGANLNLNPSNNGIPPLVYSSASGNFGIVKYLIDKGCNANETDPDGWSALHSAAEYGHFEIVKLLVNSGADVNYTNKNATAYHLSLNTHNQQLINYLKDITDPKFTQLECRQLSIVDAIKLSASARFEGKQFINTKQWNRAKSIYSQTIETIKHLSHDESIKNELAILYSNLSFVCLSLNELSGSLNAGLKSIENNPKWIKGHYRTAISYKCMGDDVNYLCYLYEAAKLEGEGGPLWKEFSDNAERIRQSKQ